MMKTMRIVMLTAAMVAVAVGLAMTAEAQDLDRRGITVGGCIRPDLDVYVWPDRGVDGVYYAGDEIRIFFEVTRDCYVVLYDIDTRGRLHVLFPFDPWQDNFVQAGRVYELPGDWDDFSLTVDGPSGDEYIQAIASPYPLDLPDWPIYVNSAGMYPTTCPDPVYRDFRAGPDRVEYIRRINRKITHRHWDYCATDLARFYVHPRPVRPYHSGYIHIDPWPDVYYGDIFIGWPIGARIYIDGIFIGIAPCRVPRLHFGSHWVRCYDGGRLLREQRVDYRHKHAYRKDPAHQRLTERYRDDVFRSAPGKTVERSGRSRPAPAIDRDRSRKSPSPEISAGKKSRTESSAPVVKKKEQTQRLPDTGRDDSGKRPSVKTESREKKGGISKIVAGIGRAVAGEIQKADGKKREFGQVVADKSPGGKQQEKAVAEKSGKIHRPENKKGR